VDPTIRALVYGVLMVWIASCVAAIADKDLIALAGITTPVISGIIAGVFAETYRRKRKSDD
jgi:hypothetical protein